MSKLKTKKSHPFLVEKMTPEEKEWSAYEKGHREGYEEGITDFEAVKAEIKKLRDKGIPVIRMDD